MASDILNTAKIIEYTYYSGGREKTGGPISDNAVNRYLLPSVDLVKQCTVVGYEESNGADLSEEIKLSYVVSNNSEAAITYETIYIEDPILTSSYISIVGSESGGTHSGNTITITPDGGLGVNDSVTYEIHIKVISPVAPTDVLGTTAVATFQTASGESNLDEDSCDLEYNHAMLNIVKENNPSGNVTYEQDIQYTITITNTGNVSATIVTGNFEDLIPDNTEFVSIDLDTGNYFEYQSANPAAIRNKSDITIDPGDANKVELKFTVKTLVQS